MSLQWRVITSCLRRPTHTFFIDDRREWKGLTLLVAAFHIAEHIRERSSSHTVAAMLPTSGAAAAVALAAWMLGRTFVPLNYLLGKDELQYVIDDCETDIIFTARPMLDFIGHTPRCGTITLLEDLNFKGVPDLFWPARSGPDDLGVLLYTSGTTGKPKGVMLTHRNIESNIRQCVRGVRFTKDDTLLGVLPQFHSFGFTVLTMLPLVVGCTTVFTARFVPTKILQLMREHRPTAFIGIPSMYSALLRAKSAAGEDFESIRFPISGGEPLPRSVAEEFEERFGVLICEGYGLTETSPVTHVLMPEVYERGTVGRALPEVEVKIADPENGHRVPRGGEGEVRLRGPNIMKGYYKLPGMTAEVFDEEGYFRTGDMGREDEQGRLSITGRIKEMMIVGGENVFPREIEEVLNAHETVRASGVIGVHDDVRGELPWAFIELEEGKEFNESALRSWCRERLAGYKVPREIRVVDELPRNPTGKIMRKNLGKFVTDDAETQ
ncbi:MAG: class I adenylate-forming enzyme family protein [Phycisphaerales bacterium]